jgi:hypothetical protein
LGLKSPGLKCPSTEKWYIVRFAPLLLLLYSVLYLGIYICNSISVGIIMLPFMPKLAGPILCCFKFNQDIIYLGYDVSRVVVHWSKPELCLTSANTAKISSD